MKYFGDGITVFCFFINIEAVKEMLIKEKTAKIILIPPMKLCPENKGKTTVQPQEKKSE